MKISELMERLGEIQGQHGDVNVYLDEYANVNQPVNGGDEVVHVCCGSIKGVPLVLLSNYKTHGDT